jgi:hypothetical protein
MALDYSKPQPSQARYYQTRRLFLKPQIVGSDFAKEAAQWYFEHGCLGHSVPVEDLPTVLSKDAFGTKVTPNACHMRSLCVTVNAAGIEELRMTSPSFSIEEQFRALLETKRTQGFILKIRVVWDYKVCIVIRRLQDLAQPLGSVIRAFEAHGSESLLEYYISANPYGDGRTNPRKWRLRRKRAALASKPYDSYYTRRTSEKNVAGYDPLLAILPQEAEGLRKQSYLTRREHVVVTMLTRTSGE